MVTRNKTKLVEWKALSYNGGIKSADFKNEFFVLEFCGFPKCLDVGKGRKLPCTA